MISLMPIMPTIHPLLWLAYSYLLLLSGVRLLPGTEKFLPVIVSEVLAS